jgi:hypothetical protein
MSYEGPSANLAYEFEADDTDTPLTEILARQRGEQSAAQQLENSQATDEADLQAEPDNQSSEDSK